MSWLIEKWIEFAMEYPDVAITIGFILNLSFWSCIIGVAYHFVVKYW